MFVRRGEALKDGRMGVFIDGVMLRVCFLSYEKFLEAVLYTISRSIIRRIVCLT